MAALRKLVCRRLAEDSLEELAKSERESIRDAATARLVELRQGAKR
jgi:hypothetical protein